MSTIERLRHDHAILRATLELLENALQVGPDAAFAIRELLYSLSRRLAEHEHREAVELYPVLQEILAGSQGEAAKSLVNEHETFDAMFRVLHVMTLRGMRMPYVRVVRIAGQLTEALRSHMAREEQLLFLILDRLEADRAANLQAKQPTSAGEPMHETMTVNRIIGLFPETKRVFECRCIDCGREGEDFLDEVAWRHAVPTSELLHELRQATHDRREEEDESVVVG